MYGKILLGTALVGLTGLLIVGAANRTIARTIPEGGGFLGRASSGEAGEGGQRRGPGGRDGGFGQGEFIQGQRSLGQVRSRAGQAIGEDTWVTLEGTVESVNPESMTVGLADGRSITVEGRAWRFAQENGFSTMERNRVMLLGYFEAEGGFEAAQIHDLSINLGVAIRDGTGRPLWAGRGGGGA